MQKLLIDYALYNQWANQRVLQMVAPISDEQFEQHLPNSFPSIRLTLLHIWDAQMIWLSRMQGNSLPEFPSKSFRGNRVKVVENLEKNTADYLAFVQNMPLVQFEASCSYSTTSGKALTQSFGELIHHCLNHSTFHRGQIITMLRQLGQTEFISTDYIYYLRNK